MDNFLDNKKVIALEFTLETLKLTRGHLLNVIHNMRELDLSIVQDAQLALASVTDMLSRVQKIEEIERVTK